MAIQVEAVAACSAEGRRRLQGCLDRRRRQGSQVSRRASSVAVVIRRRVRFSEVRHSQLGRRQVLDRARACRRSNPQHQEVAPTKLHQLKLHHPCSRSQSQELRRLLSSEEIPTRMLKVLRNLAEESSRPREAASSGSNLRARRCLAARTKMRVSQRRASRRSSGVRQLALRNQVSSANKKSQRHKKRPHQPKRASLRPSPSAPRRRRRLQNHQVVDFRWLEPILRSQPRAKKRTNMLSI